MQTSDLLKQGDLVTLVFKPGCDFFGREDRPEYEFRVRYVDGLGIAGDITDTSIDTATKLTRDGRFFFPWSVLQSVETLCTNAAYEKRWSELHRAEADASARNTQGTGANWGTIR